MSTDTRAARPPREARCCRPKRQRPSSSIQQGIDSRAVTPQFHSLRIREVRPETADAAFRLSDVSPELRDAFRFTQGQFVTLEDAYRRRGNAPFLFDLRRRDGLRPRRRTAHRHQARAAAAGSRTSPSTRCSPAYAIDVMTPDGRFFTAPERRPLEAATSRSPAARASRRCSPIIKSTLDTEPRSRFTLVYGNRSVDHDHVLRGTRET